MQNNSLSELIKIIEDKANISEIVSDYITLEKKGNNHVGLCPFHSDSNPSMSVSDQKNIFKCFVCGAGGNAISFVQNYEGINFIEAVKKVSESLKIDWTKYISQKRIKIDPEKQRGWEINEEALNFFKYNLNNNSSQEVKQYISTRGLDGDILEKFDIGYASEGLSNFLLNKNFTEDEIVKYGLAKRKEDTTLQDYFIDRLIFTIRNRDGKISGFSGRVIKDSKYVKYMNSPENPVFKKSEILYNLNNAKIPGNLKKELIVVEGFMDVIALTKAGVDNSIATMGTAFTKEHTKQITSITKKVVLAFDSDSAGINATISTGKTMVQNKVDTHVVTIPNGKDFDELLKLGVDNINKTLGERKSFLQFYKEMIFKKLDSQGDNATFDVLKELYKLLSYNDDKILTNVIIGQISEKYKIDKEVLLEEYSNNTSDIKNVNKDYNDNIQPEYIPNFEPEFIEQQYNTQEVKLKNYADKISRNDNRNSDKMWLMVMEEEILSYAFVNDYAFQYLLENPIVIMNDELRRIWEVYVNSVKNNISIEDEFIFTRITSLKMMNKNLVENSELNEVYDLETFTSFVKKYNDSLRDFNRRNLMIELHNESDPNEKEHILRMLSNLK